MLEIGHENVAKTFDTYQNDRELQKEYPYFRDYLNAVYNSIFSSSH